jgi:calcium/proton exchanger cax
MRPLYGLSTFIPVALALALANASPSLVFVTSALGIVPTAAVMSEATEQLAARSGPGIGGLVNVAFGNAPELIIAVFALANGLQEVVKASLVGSIIGNSLLVLAAGDARRRLETHPTDVRSNGRADIERDAAAHRGGARFAPRFSSWPTTRACRA